MKETTLCFLLKDDKVLLAMKKRGFGVGKWNGVGGKIQDGEDVKNATIREVQEEIGVDILSDDLNGSGTLEFHFKDNPDWDNFCHIFTTTTWSSEPMESEEMRPQWYLANAMPFAEMWVDDHLWLPPVLAGKKIRAKFLFDAEGKNILDSHILEI